MSSHISENKNANNLIYPKVIFWLIATAVILFFISTFFRTNVKNANAYSSMDQQDYTQVQAESGSHVYTGQTWTATTDGCVNTVSMYVEKVGTGDWRCQLCNKPKGVNQGNCSSLIYIGGASWQTFSWPNADSCSSFAVTQDSEYWLSLSCMQSHDANFYGSSSDVYSGGAMGTSTDYGTTLGTPFLGTIYDQAMQIDITPDSDLVWFNSTPTSTCDFQFWDVGWSIHDDSDPTSMSVGVGYKLGASGTPYFYNDNTYLAKDGYGSNLGNPYALPKQGILAGDVIYYARAYLCDSQDEYDCFFSATNPHIIATSQEYEFVVDPWSTCSSSQTYVFQGEEAYTEDPPTSTPFFGFSQSCDALDSTISRALCNAMRFLFVPEQNSLDRFLNLKTALEDKPPFGYIGVYTDALGGFDTSTTTTSTLNTATSTPTFTFVTELSIWDKFNTFFDWFLYLVFGFYIYKRFKNFSLQG